MKNWLKVDWQNLNYGRLGKHLAGAFFIAVGSAGAAKDPLWPAVCAWFWGALIYTGGAIQNYGKEDSKDEQPKTAA